MLWNGLFLYNGSTRGIFIPDNIFNFSLISFFLNFILNTI